MEGKQKSATEGKRPNVEKHKEENLEQQTEGKRKDEIEKIKVKRIVNQSNRDFKQNNVHSSGKLERIRTESSFLQCNGW